jgi:hypothetical protein
MVFARITRHGLASIAILVAILWGCVLAERSMTRNSRIETYRALKQIRYLKFKRHVEPAATPSTKPAPSSGPVSG